VKVIRQTDIMIRNEIATLKQNLTSNHAEIVAMIDQNNNLLSQVVSTQKKIDLNILEALHCPEIVKNKLAEEKSKVWKINVNMNIIYKNQ
jgi:hypothetical protein